MLVMIVGKGGREHALGWKASQSPLCKHIYFVPGNAGTEKLGTNVPLMPHETTQIVTYAKKEGISLVIIGPEEPLAAGLADELRTAGMRVFGPGREAAQLESSKAFAKEFMREYDIPTAPFEVFDSYTDGAKYVRREGVPIVIKADGPARGQGVRICESFHDAEKALDDFMVKHIHGDAGKTVVIERCIRGREISLHGFLRSGGNSSSVLRFPIAHDEKTLLDGGKGPNTGGMGTYVPVTWAERVRAETYDIFDRALAGLQHRGLAYAGIFYPGGVITKDAHVYTYEFNVRWGDSEAQSYARLMRSDLLKHMDDYARGNTISPRFELAWRPGYAVCVVLAARGYPLNPALGDEVSGIEEAEQIPEVVIFHAGTRREGNRILTAGGRVLCITAYGETLGVARARAYKALGLIKLKGRQFRTDIGKIGC